jgi:hypothetical protein
MWPRRCLFVLAFLMIACTPPALGGVIPHLLYGKRISGQVVDAETRKPLAGAHVAFLWESPITSTVITGHDSRDICYHAAAVQTGADGYFQIDAWRTWSNYDVHNVEPTGVVYTPHYVPYFVVFSISPNGEAVEHDAQRYELKPFAGTRRQRLETLFRGLANHDCLNGGESQKSLYPMLKAIHTEARQVAETPDDMRVVSAIARLAAETALAQDPNVPWDEERAKAFIREYLK